MVCVLLRFFIFSLSKKGVSFGKEVTVSSTRTFFSLFWTPISFLSRTNGLQLSLTKIFVFLLDNTKWWKRQKKRLLKVRYVLFSGSEWRSLVIENKNCRKPSKHNLMEYLLVLNTEVFFWSGKNFFLRFFRRLIFLH